MGVWEVLAKWKLITVSRTSRRRYQSPLTSSWDHMQLEIPVSRPNKVSNRLDSELVRPLPMMHPASWFRAIRCGRASQGCPACRFAHHSHVPTRRPLGSHTPAHARVTP